MSILQKNLCVKDSLLVSVEGSLHSLSALWFCSTFLNSLASLRARLTIDRRRAVIVSLLAAELCVNFHVCSYFIHCAQFFFPVLLSIKKWARMRIYPDCHSVSTRLLPRTIIDVEARWLSCTAVLHARWRLRLFVVSLDLGIWPFDAETCRCCVRLKYSSSLKLVWFIVSYSRAFVGCWPCDLDFGAI